MESENAGLINVGKGYISKISCRSHRLGVFRRHLHICTFAWHIALQTHVRGVILLPCSWALLQDEEGSREKEKRKHREREERHKDRKDRHKEKREHRDRDRDGSRKERHREKRGHDNSDDDREERKRERHR